jgi:DNA-binding GntR family transcriptional regulator
MRGSDIASPPGAAGRDAAERRIEIGLPDDPRAWVRAANTMLRMIADGVVKPGGRVPAKQQLAMVCRCGSGTAGKALRALAAEGVLTSVPGLGTFVQPACTVTADPVTGRLTAILPGGGP